MWLECNCLVFLSPCICPSLFRACRWEDAYFSCGVPLVSFSSCGRSCLCTLGILTQQYNVTLVHSFVLPTTTTTTKKTNLLTLPPRSLSPYLLTKCMHAYGVRCRQGCWFKKKTKKQQKEKICFVSRVCFSKLHLLASLHAILEFQSVTFLRTKKKKKWNHSTLWE